MFRGPAIQPFEVAPRVMPDGVLPVDGIHYNIHPGQPVGLPGADDQAVPRTQFDSRTVKIRNPLQATPARLMEGEQLFLTNCSPCHGIGGEGDGTVAHLLKHKPDNLTKNETVNRPDGYIYEYIRTGRSRMPAYNDAMSSSERWEVILYLRHLQAVAKMQKRAPRPISSDTNSPAKMGWRHE
jgi:mono/diheme cytochrome c family protein